MGFGDDEEFVPPTNNPPKFIYHGKRPVDMPEEIRRIFGTDPPPNSSKPKPPPPPPPNSYHVKPKYWQTRGTGHMAQTNRISGVVCGLLCVFSLLLFKFNDAPHRLWTNWLGFDEITPESIEKQKAKNAFFWHQMRGLPADSFNVDLKFENYTNPRKLDNQLRWDLREIDQRVVGLRDMGNPFPDAL